MEYPLSNDQLTANISTVASKIEFKWPHWDSKVCRDPPPLAKILLLCHAIIPLSKLKAIQKTWIDARLSATSKHWFIPDRALAAEFTTLVEYHSQRAVDVDTFKDQITNVLEMAAAHLPHIPDIQQEMSENSEHIDFSFLAQVWKSHTTSQKSMATLLQSLETD